MGILTISERPRKWYQIIGWWELRRLPYNVIMLIAGISSLSIASVIIPLIYLMIGVGLNAIYTLGWITELVVSSSIKEVKWHQRFAPIA
jgi:hypothetical protein